MDIHHSEPGTEKEMCAMRCHRHKGVRALTAVIVVIFVFWCGFEFGEIRASVGFAHEGSYRMMQNSGRSGSEFQPMMRSATGFTTGIAPAVAPTPTSSK
jgi:hypothetical protein